MKIRKLKKSIYEIIKQQQNQTKKLLYIHEDKEIEEKYLLNK